MQLLARKQVSNEWSQGPTIAHHNLTHAMHDFVGVINLHLQWSLEVRWVLKNRRHKSQFYGLGRFLFTWAKNCDSWTLFLSTHLTSKLRRRWRLITPMKSRVACVGVWWAMPASEQARGIPSSCSFAFFSHTPYFYCTPLFCYSSGTLSVTCTYGTP